MNIVLIDGGFCRVRQHCSDTETIYAAPDGCRCWHCSNLISNVSDVSVPLPVNYDDRRDLYTVCGHFCSIGCMNAYSSLARKIGISRVGNGMYLFRFIKELTGISNPQNFPLAPPREVLRDFGGFMTYDEFYHQFNTMEFIRLPKNCVLKEEILLKKTRSFDNRKANLSRTSIKSMLLPDEKIGDHSETIKVIKRKDVLLKNKSVEDDVKDLREQLCPDTDKKKKTILEQMLETSA